MLARQLDLDNDVLRATDYDVAVSANRSSWTTVATVRNTSNGDRDVLHFAPIQARFVGLRLHASTASQPPMLDEIQVMAS